MAALKPTPAPGPIPVRVKYRSGAYDTNTVRGQRASSTGGSVHAVTSLGHKLFPSQPFQVLYVDGTVAGGCENWLIVT